VNPLRLRSPSSFAQGELPGRQVAHGSPPDDERNFDYWLRRCRGFDVVGTGRKGAVESIRGSNGDVDGLIVRFGPDLVLIRKQHVERIDPQRQLIFLPEHLGARPTF
jgi:hypothetical protein